MIVLPLERSNGMAKRSKFQIRSDAAKLRWHVRDDQKESFWRKHLTAWKRSELSKLAYCKEHDLTYSSFMSWKREIEIRDREKSPPADAAALLTDSVKPPGLFVPIRLVHNDDQETSQGPPSSEAECDADSAKQSIEILLPGGAVIRLNQEGNPRFIAELLSALKP